MKKILLFLLVAGLGFAFNSCSSDDDKGPDFTVEGKWEITKYTVNGQPMQECAHNGVRQFKPDGVYLQDDYIEDEVDDCVESPDSPLIGTFVQYPRDLRITLGGTTTTYRLEFLSESKFMLIDTYNNIDFVYTYTKL